MTLGFNTLFNQRDVRETATAISGTFYLSITGSAFVPINPDTDQVTYGDNSVTADSNGITFKATVNLPHGAVITKIIVYGNAAAAAGETYKLSLSTISASIEGGILAGPTSFDTEDTTINNATINNAAFTYYITTSSLDTGDEINGVKITYTI